MQALRMRPNLLGVPAHSRGGGEPESAKANREAATGYMTQVPQALTTPPIEYVRAPGPRLSRRWLRGSI